MFIRKKRYEYEKDALAKLIAEESRKISEAINGRIAANKDTEERVKAICDHLKIELKPKENNYQVEGKK